MKRIFNWNRKQAKPRNKKELKRWVDIRKIEINVCSTLMYHYTSIEIQISINVAFV